MGAERREGPVFGPALLVLALVVALPSLAALGIGVMDSPRTLMSPADYVAARKTIEADARLALARCREHTVDNREVCRTEARAQERLLKADLAAQYLGTAAASHEALGVRAKVRYEIARARCALRG